MLVELHIENIAVIQKATIPLKKGFNVFTGETGAGKTILISAIDAVLGERTSRDIIRAGEEKAVVSALFENISPEIKKNLEDMGYKTEDDSVIIYREMTTSGKNTCRINGMPANVTTLKEASKHLIHIHGQRDSQELLSKENHLKMIDDYGELKSSVSEYQDAYYKMQNVKKKLSEMNMDESQKAQKLDMLEFQIKEIEDAKLEDIGEEDYLLSQKRMAAGSEKIRRGLQEALGAYSGSGEAPGISDLFSVLLTGTEDAAEYMEELSPIVERLQDISYEMQDIVGDIQNSLEVLDFDPAELENIERRLDIIYKLKQKYGSSIAQVLVFYDNAVIEYESISFSDKRKEELEKELAILKNNCSSLAQKLSRQRSISCKNFIKQVQGELAFLDMPSAQLSVAHNSVDFTPNGTDELEFMIITNMGETPKPLGKIASGGELARIMLSIKNIMADKDNVDTLIFDEIDTGVSGKAAGKIGRKLAEVSNNRQVIGVTHLAQVAAFSSNHLYIHKETEKGRTYTKVTPLNEEEAIKELARITSGEVITKAALQSAKELIQRARMPYNE